MARVVYGYWKNQIIDNRGVGAEERSEAPLKIDEDFNGKTLGTMVSWEGFLVFEEGADIVGALAKYMYEISGYGCCGRCFPGRVGTRLLAEQLEKIGSNGCSDADLQTLKEMAISINESAKCTVAPTAVIPVLAFLNNFADEIGKEGNSKSFDYVRHLTAPCTAGCPAGVKIPEFIEELKDFRFEDSLATIRETMPLPGVCGRVCPHPCEANCRRGLVDDDPVSIMVLKRTPWDYEYYHHKDPKLPAKAPATGKKVMIVGAGPAGLTAAYYLALLGHTVKIIDMINEPGGMVAVGIPDYREPRELLRREVEIIQSLGVEIEYGVTLGKDVQLEDLKKQYDSVLIAIGAWKSRDMGVEGEKNGYKGVIPSGIGYLYDYSIGKETGCGKKVVVVGGGNTAIDCVRTAIREKADEVTLVYRRSRNEMPAEEIEIVDAEAEGVIYKFLCNPVGLVVENGELKGLKCVEMELGEPDASGRRSPQPKKDSEFIIECDTVIPAIGQFPDLDFLKESDGISVTKWGTFNVKEDLYQTDQPNIFSAGDCEWGPMTVVKAIGAGRWAAVMMDRYMNEGKVYLTAEEKLELTLIKNKVFDKKEQVCEAKTIHRVHQEKLAPEYRIHNLEEIEKPFTEKQAYDEATRCLRCMRMAMVGLSN